MRVKIHSWFDALFVQWIRHRAQNRAGVREIVIYLDCLNGTPAVSRGRLWSKTSPTEAPTKHCSHIVLRGTDPRREPQSPSAGPFGLDDRLRARAMGKTKAEARKGPASRCSQMCVHQTAMCRVSRCSCYCAYLRKENVQKTYKNHNNSAYARRKTTPENKVRGLPASFLPFWAVLLMVLFAYVCTVAKKRQRESNPICRD